jgi:uncharacterized membrane protein YpjA
MWTQNSEEEHTWTHVRVSKSCKNIRGPPLTWVPLSPCPLSYILFTLNKYTHSARLPLTNCHSQLHVKCFSRCCIKYRVWQKYLTILQNSCEWNHWHREFVLECSSSETQSISVAMEHWSVKHQAFAVVTYFKNNDSVLTQSIFCWHFNIHRNKCP